MIGHASYINRKCLKCGRLLRHRDEVSWAHPVFTLCTACSVFGIPKKQKKAQHPKWAKRSYKRKDIMFRQRSIADGKRPVRCV